VEPDADTRLLYRLSLSEFQAEVEEAPDGAQALAVALSRTPDLVISELRMPRVDGFALCSLLRSDEQTKNAAILIVTGSGAADVIQTAHARGADAVLTKPCSPETLASTVGTLLQRKDGRAAALNPPPLAPAAGEPRPKPRAMSRACLRGVTNTPPTPPPSLHCPRCDGALEYQHSQLGGVNARFSERWDYFLCSHCGVFQYRHRTRKLRAIEERMA
jgi:CheY-like chemotaxis protein